MLDPVAGHPRISRRGLSRAAAAAGGRGQSREGARRRQPHRLRYPSAQQFRRRSRYLKNQLGQDQSAGDAWYAHWIREGFDAIEALIEPGPFAFGSEPTLADIYLVPQVFNARRFNIPLDAYPKIAAVDAACAKLTAFEEAAPANQPDAA